MLTRPEYRQTEAAARRGRLLRLALLLSAVLFAATVHAQDGRLLATGGALPIDGAAGGGIVPWAVLSGYGTGDESGATAAFTGVETDDYSFSSLAASFTWHNRVELSFATQELDIGALTPVLTFDPGVLEQDIFGVKFRILGDAIFTRAPQLSAGLLHKRNEAFLIPSAVGAVDDDETEVYVAATRVWLAGLLHRTTLINMTLRSTSANQTGLLGFGGDLDSGRGVLAEISAAVFVNRKLAVGFEFREKPDNLSFAAEHHWRDAFVAWFPNKHVSLVAAWADLGSIAGLDGQDGLYLSLQGTLR